MSRRRKNRTRNTEALYVDSDVNDSIVRNKMKQICISRYKYKNLPNNIPHYIIEEYLYNHGKCCLYKNEIGDINVFMFNDTSIFDIYGRPFSVMLTAKNGTVKEVQFKDIVPIYNNSNKLSDSNTVFKYSSMIDELEDVIGVNVRTLKRPIAFTAPDEMVIDINNFLNGYRENEAIVLSTSNTFDKIKVENIMPKIDYQINQLNIDKQIFFNEFLTLVGIDNNGLEKKERKTSAEVDITNESIKIIANDYINNRILAINEANKKWGLNIEVVKC